MSRALNERVRSLKPGDSFEEWDRFVDESPQGCIFCKSWWLQAVCPKEFEILIVEEGSRIVGGMPLVRSRTLMWDVIRMPPLTQTLGVVLSPPASAKYEKQLTATMEMTADLMRALPKYDFYDVCFSYNFTNWLPFYWAGYDQTTCYTYVLEDLTDLDEVFAGFAHSKRKNIKKAESQVTLKEDLSPQDFFANHEMTLAKQGQRINYSYDLFERVYQATHQRNAGKTWYAVDENGNLHAAILVVFDVKSAYYLVSTIDPDYRNSGAGTLLIKHAIAWVSKHTRKFDFEGSMIPGVEHSFRKFGARQKPYFRISRNLLPWPVRAYLNRRRLRRRKAQNLKIGSDVQE